MALKTLHRDVTNLELWLLIGCGLMVGLSWNSRWRWIALVAALGSGLMIPWWRGYCGLDQWPNPHGRYYKQWLGLKDVGDYYEWLARRLGDGQPWSGWAKLEKEQRPG